MLDSLLEAIVADVTGLAITLNAVPVRTVKRKGPKHEPGVDDPTLITVAQAEEHERTLFHAFSQPPSTEWLLEINTCSPNNRDYLTNLPTYASWREEIKTLFCPPTLFSTALWHTAGVWDVRPEPGKFLERTAMANNLDDMSVYLRIKTNP
jgi:hypothetical protein